MSKKIDENTKEQAKLFLTFILNDGDFEAFSEWMTDLKDSIEWWITYEIDQWGQNDEDRLVELAKAADQKLMLEEVVRLWGGKSHAELLKEFTDY